MLLDSLERLVVAHGKSCQKDLFGVLSFLLLDKLLRSLYQW